MIVVWINPDLKQYGGRLKFIRDGGKETRFYKIGQELTKIKS